MKEMTMDLQDAGCLACAGSGKEVAAARAAAAQLVDCYAELALTQSHLLTGLLDGALPCQWQHYPEDDVIDPSTGYQYFYHSHAAERGAGAEHGHFHLFARLDEPRLIDHSAEHAFLASLEAPKARAKTVNLLAIAVDAKGVPVQLFTVNRWVTGDHLLSAQSTLRLLRGFRMQKAGPQLINRWLAALLQLFWPEIVTLLQRRDRRLLQLSAKKGGEVLENRQHEILSRIAIDIDGKLAALSATEQEVQPAG